MAPVDRFTLDVLRNSLASLVDEMGVMLMRCGMSPVITQGRDFSGAVLTKSGELVMQGSLGIPAHVGTMPFTVEAILEDFPDDVRPGDVFMTNDPHRAGTHLPDIRLAKPVFVGDRLIAFLINCGHFTDVGGALPGGFNPQARDCFTEGLLIPPMKVVREAELSNEVMNVLLYNCRQPEIARADLLGLLASLDLGGRRFQDVVERYGINAVLETFDDHLQVNEKALRSIIQALPDGEYSMTDYIGRDPGSESDDPIECVLVMRIEGEDVTFDFTESAPTPKGAVSATLPSTTSGVVIGLKWVFPELEMCGGLNRALEIKTAPGSVFHALWPAPVSGAGGAPVQRVVDLVFGCLAQVIPDRVMACPATTTNYTQAGLDSRRDTLFDDYILYVWTEGGYGARLEKDNSTFVTVLSGGSMNQSIELYEQLYPIVWDRMELIPDSGGAGRRRGGLGDVRRVRLAGARTANLSSMGDRQRFPAWGLAGGKPGRKQGFALNPGTVEAVSIDVMTASCEVGADDFWDYWSGGGGGFGHPLEREPERVLEDVKDGYVSVDGARRDYGVVIQAEGIVYDDWVVDGEATATLRTGLRASSGLVEEVT